MLVLVLNEKYTSMYTYEYNIYTLIIYTVESYVMYNIITIILLYSILAYKKI